MACPVLNGSNNLPKWIRYAKTWKGISLFIFAENNSTDNTLELIADSGLPCKLIRVWFQDDIFHSDDVSSHYAGIANIRQLILSYARRLDVDFLVFVDADVYPQDERFIQKLISRKSDIAGAGYVRNFEVGPRITAIFPDNSRRLFIPDKTVKVPCVGGGCMCISKKVLQDRRVNFVPLIPEHAEDFGYCRQAHLLGYSVLLDVSTNVEHSFGGSPRPWCLQHPKFTYSDPGESEEPFTKPFNPPGA